MTDYVRRSDAERLSAKHAAHIAEIERDMIARILDRVRAGDDSPNATVEEVQRALARLAALSAAFEKALNALPSFPEAPSK
jgi:hypothetical protein